MIAALLLLLVMAPAGAGGPGANPFDVVPRCGRQSAGDDIVVCGRRDQAERFRLPIRPEGFDPKGPIDSVSRERNRLIQEGDAGIGSCSNVGPGGSTGCFARSVKRRCEQEGCGIAF